MSDAVLFTIFTPTYNRAHTLKRVFDSLSAQSLRDFEWLVVDDGSTDNTAELIAGWANIADFPIRYFKQKHAGKHIAHNLALGEGRGKFFLPLDSDDACNPRALERFVYHWNTIPERDRTSFSGVVALCCDQYNEIIGDKFPNDPFDANWRDAVYVHHVRGEKWGPLLMEVVRRRPFPKIRGTNFVPEGLVWLDIAKRYQHKIRFVNEVLRTYYVEHTAAQGNLTTLRKRADNAPGRLVYYVWLLNNDLSYFFDSPAPFLRAAVNLPIVTRNSGHTLCYTIRSLHSVFAKALFLLGLPVSALIVVIDRIRKLAGV